MNKHGVHLSDHTVLLLFICSTKVILSNYIRLDSLRGVVFLTTIVRLGAESTRTNKHHGTRIYLLDIVTVVYIFNNRNAARLLTFHPRYFPRYLALDPQQSLQLCRGYFQRKDGSPR